MDLALQMQCWQRVMDESVYEFNCVCVDSVDGVAISIFYGVCVCHPHILGLASEVSDLMMQPIQHALCRIPDWS